MDYMMLIDRITRLENDDAHVQILFSGADRIIRQAILKDILKKSQLQHHQLFIVDDKRTPDVKDYNILRAFGYYPKNVLSGGYKLYNPFQADTLMDTGQFRQLMAILGYDEKQKAKLFSYFHFLTYLDYLSGDPDFSVISTEKLSRYSTFLAVEDKIQALVDAGTIDSRQQIHLLSKYSEYSPAAADLDDMLPLLIPFIQGKELYEETSSDKAFIIPTGSLGQDDTARSIILHLLQAGLCDASQARRTLILFDKGYGNRHSICSFLEALPKSMDVHILSSDIFTLCGTSERASALSRFSVKIYSRHQEMASCGEIEKEFGDRDVVHSTYTVSRDRHLRANGPLDFLLGKNKTEIYGQSAPVREPRYRKESIASFRDGTGIISFMGQTSVFTI